MKTLKRGSKGEEVKTLQKWLNAAGYATIDDSGVFTGITEAAVRLFQAEHGLVVDGIVGPKTWAALDPSTVFGLKKSSRSITEIIVHCSATPEGRNVSTEAIKRYHMTHGWNDIAYNYVIELDGSIHDGRDVNKVGGHTANHNRHSIGVCYVGGCAKDGKTAKDTRTEEQKAALLTLLKELKQLYPAAVIYGHRNFANKACPSFDAKAEYKDI